MRRHLTAVLLPVLAILLAANLLTGCVTPTQPGMAKPLLKEMEAQTAGLSDAAQLSTEGITQAFADVRDEAEVQDSADTTAVNYWYADGRFVNEWTNSDGSGKVTARWRAEDGKRCVLIESGLPDRIGKETCGPIYRRGQTYLSLNPDGSIHGKHTLSPLDKTGR